MPAPKEESGQQSILDKIAYSDYQWVTQVVVCSHHCPLANLLAGGAGTEPGSPKIVRGGRM